MAILDHPNELQEANQLLHFQKPRSDAVQTDHRNAEETEEQQWNEIAPSVLLHSLCMIRMVNQTLRWLIASSTPNCFTKHCKLVELEVLSILTIDRALYFAENLFLISNDKAITIIRKRLWVSSFEGLKSKLWDRSPEIESPANRLEDCRASGDCQVSHQFSPILTQIALQIVNCFCTSDRWMFRGARECLRSHEIQDRLPNKDLPLIAKRGASKFKVCNPI